MKQKTDPHQRLLARANAFVMDDTKEEEEVADCKTLIGRFEEAIENQNDARIARYSERLSLHIKGTKVSISLSEDEVAEATRTAEAFKTFFDTYPTLSVPREHTLEKFTAAFISAMKEAKK